MIIKCNIIKSDYVLSYSDAVKNYFINYMKNDINKIKQSDTLLDYIISKSHLEKCINKPIIMSMAKVQSPLYWKLIEGFFHSMFYFDHLDCSIMICVSGTFFFNSGIVNFKF